MRAALTIFLAGLLLALPASAQIEGSLGGIKNIVTKGEAEEEIGQGFLGAVAKMPLSESGRHLFAFAINYDTESESEGMSLRYYYDPVLANGVRPGFGIGGWRLDRDSIDLLGMNTTLIGAEVLLDIELPVAGGSVLPATAMIGYYTRVAGEAGVGMLRFGAQLSPSLLN